MSNDHVHPIFQSILAGITEAPLCIECETRPAIAGEELCPDCRDNAAEGTYERAQEEPCFRGGEWASAQAAEMDWVRRNLK